MVPIRRCLSGQILMHTAPGLKRGFTWMKLIGFKGAFARLQGSGITTALGFGGTGVVLTYVVCICICTCICIRMCFLYMSKCMYMCMCIYIDIYADSLYKRTMRFRGASMFWFVLSERRIPED